MILRPSQIFSCSRTARYRVGKSKSAELTVPLCPEKHPQPTFDGRTPILGVPRHRSLRRRACAARRLSRSCPTRDPKRPTQALYRRGASVISLLSHGRHGTDWSWRRRITRHWIWWVRLRGYGLWWVRFLVDNRTQLLSRCNESRQGLVPCNGWEAQGGGENKVTRHLAITQRQARTLLRAAETEREIVEVKMGEAVIRLIPECHAQPAGQSTKKRKSIFEQGHAEKAASIRLLGTVPTRKARILFPSRQRSAHSASRGKLRQYFRAACNAAASRNQRTSVRKSARHRAAEAGATTQELQALFGTGGAMASHYTKTADRKRSAKQAAEKINNAQRPHPIGKTPAPQKKPTLFKHLRKEICRMVRSRRLELPRVAPQRPQRCASTNSATTARHEGPARTGPRHVANRFRRNKSDRRVEFPAYVRAES